MSTQDSFARALLDAGLPCPSGLCAANGADPASRFAVYRNNVQSSLINALADGFPVVAQLVGDEFFRAMGRHYVQNFPPTSPLLNDYGRDFAGFVQGFAPAASLPYLADIARLEQLRVMAYHAADACAVEPAQIAAAMGALENLGRLRLHLHPSVHTLSSAHGVVAVWAAHQTDGEVPPIDPSPGQCALVLRNGLEVQVFAVDAGSATFIESLKNHWPLEIAAAYALDAQADFDLSQCLALLISHGAITHLQPQEKA